MSRLCICVLATLSLLCGCQRDISGTYLASDKTAVMWLQLVRTPDDHLTGQLSLSKLNTDGKIEYNSASLAGAIGGENVTLSGSGAFGLQTFTFSGILVGNRLTFSGSNDPTPFVLIRSEMADYQKQLGNLNALSQAILAAKANAQLREKPGQAQRNFVAQIDQLIGKMQRFDTDADAHLVKFSDTEKKYQAITTKVNQYVEREHHLAGNPNTAVDRSGLYSDATVAAIDTNLLHMDVQSLQQDFETDGKSMADDATNLDAVCHGRGTTPRADLTSVQVEAISDACGRLTNALNPFRQRYSAVTAGLAHLEQVYIQEKSRQQGLLQTAQRLQ